MHCTLAAATHEPAARLAAELVDIAPEGLNRVFYSDNGSTAVEVALKIAFQYWQQNGRPERTRFLALPGAYHGDTLGAMSAGDVDEFTGVFRPLLFDVQRPPDALDHQWEPVFERLFALLREDADQIAGVIVEPMVQGAAGMRMYPAELLAVLRHETKRVDTFLIADEVFTGLGRTGPMWAGDHAGIAPDLLCTAKGLSGGVLPFAATLATDAKQALITQRHRNDWPGKRCLITILVQAHFGVGTIEVHKATVWIPFDAHHFAPDC